MKRAGFVFALIVLLAMLLPIPKPGEYGAYNTISGWIYCSEEWSCLHEIGHALDKEAGWISQSPAFAEALQMYVLVNAGSDDLTIYILAMTYGPKDQQEPLKKELYAYLFQQADGRRENMPATFQKFYDWDAAEMKIEKMEL